MQYHSHEATSFTNVIFLCLDRKLFHTQDLWIMLNIIYSHAEVSSIKCCSELFGLIHSL